MRGCDFAIIQTVFTAHSENVEEASIATEDLKQSIADSHGMIGLSRLTPKVYPPLKQRSQALRDETYRVLRKDKNGAPIGELFRKGDAKWKQVPWVMATVVTKIKTDGTVKSRLCLRGDRIPSADQPFASAPTASRDFMEVFCGLYVNFEHFSRIQVDVSKAFTQSDLFNERGRIAARVPDFAGVNGYTFHGHIATSNKADQFEKG